ncbi:MAG TPA: hypothetical protein PJ990_15880, partial [Saprospiraceae bacterium]|nr:hypothetical protein [Saprospiraceae bacterium]
KEFKFERYPSWDGDVLKSYRLYSSDLLIFRAHPVYCNKPDYITAGIISKDNKVKSWYDFTTKESFQEFLVKSYIEVTYNHLQNNASFIEKLSSPLFDIFY